MRLQVVAVALQQARPVAVLRDGRQLRPRRLRLLVRHLQEEQVGQLLDVVAVGEAIVPQDVAVVPELLTICWASFGIRLMRLLCDDGAWSRRNEAAREGCPEDYLSKRSGSSATSSAWTTTERSDVTSSRPQGVDNRFPDLSSGEG